MATGTIAVTAAARWADVIYATGLYYKSVLASTASHVPLVVKLTTDPAFERARRLGLFAGDLKTFQHARRGVVVRYLKLVRRAMLSRSDRVVIPSRYLAEIAKEWGVPADRVAVVPNPAPPVNQLASREELRRRLELDGATLVFAGRLVPAKHLPLAISALQQVPGVALVVIGEGPERQRLEAFVADLGLADRLVFKGALSRAATIEWLRAADAALLSSAWENFPHAAVEAIATGTPVVATAVGGVPEVIETGVNGILVPPGDEHALAEAMRSVTTDANLVARLRRGAAVTAAQFGADRAYGALERELVMAAGRRGARA
jgi:glycosyltransferase involved in cell wall biosynthesis